MIGGNQAGQTKLKTYLILTAAMMLVGLMVMMYQRNSAVLGMLVVEGLVAGGVIMLCRRKKALGVALTVLGCVVLVAGCIDTSLIARLFRTRFSSSAMSRLLRSLLSELFYSAVFYGTAYLLGLYAIVGDKARKSKVWLILSLVAAAVALLYTFVQIGRGMALSNMLFILTSIASHTMGMILLNDVYGVDGDKAGQELLLVCVDDVIPGATLSARTDAHVTPAAPSATAAPAALPGKDDLALETLLALFEIRQEGLLTEAEFEQKKAELLQKI